MQMTTDRRSFQRVATFDDLDTVNDATDLLFMEHYISGSHPFAQSAYIPRVRDGASLIPHGVEPIRVAVSDGTKSVLASGPDWILCTTKWRDGSARVSVAAQSEDTATTILEAATRDVQAPQLVDPSQAEIGFWHLGQRGPLRTERTVSVPGWSTIRRNYSAKAGRALEGLMSKTKETLGGRMLLLYGPPGTGKTTALRALADQWRAWCQLDYVVDPECLFKEPSYLLNVALDSDNQVDQGTRARMLILEDCDELIVAGAKDRSGQGLARLLNLTDGLLGQGLFLLIAITTNEALTRLHPAVTRPGRCFAQVEVGRLSKVEARQWLGRESQDVAVDMTLAELIALRDGSASGAPSDIAARVGQYL
jgi:hypothetical protein